jgi:hypothetical protein
MYLNVDLKKNDINLKENSLERNDQAQVGQKQMVMES